ncbi:hypothetical protein TNCV_1389261 [Trichonephila clavipes]|nr:hypothetical protein TNCV_1389261 [Trichonephila clavipes]
MRQKNISLKDCTATGVRKCMDFFWGHTKCMVYETPILSVEDPIARIFVAALKDKRHARNLSERTEFHETPLSDSPPSVRN